MGSQSNNDNELTDSALNKHNSRPFHLRKRSRLERLPHLPKMWKGLWLLHSDTTFRNRIAILFQMTLITLKHK